MKITKVINNNTVSSKDEKGVEIVVMGKGIAFGKRVGDSVEESKIRKVFRLSGSARTNQFLSLAEKVPYDYIQTAEEIIAYAKKNLTRKLSDNIYIALTDHINFAIERQKQGIQFQNALRWETRRFYSQEYRIGQEALCIIRDRLHISLPEDEAGFIAIHLVNAELDTDTHQSFQVVRVIKDIESIIKYHFNISLDKESLAYERFITHLKFFVQRVVRGQCYDTIDEKFSQMIRNQYKEAYACVQKIRTYINKQMNYDLTEEEEVYLTVHIKRVVDVEREHQQNKNKQGTASDAAV